MSRSLDHQDDPDARTYDYTDTELMVRMFRYLLTYRAHLFAVIVLVAINIGVGVYSPFVLRQAIDEAHDLPRLLPYLKVLEALYGGH